MSIDSFPQHQYNCYIYYALCMRHLNDSQDILNQINIVKVWLRENADDYRFKGNGYVITDVSFKHPEDLVAFKLKFNI